MSLCVVAGLGSLAPLPGIVAGTAVSASATIIVIARLMVRFGRETLTPFALTLFELFEVVKRVYF